jgi:DNA-directed RNA polymerase subunit beta'
MEPKKTGPMAANSLNGAYTISDIEEQMKAEDAKKQEGRPTN